MRNDLVYALRGLLRNRGFALAAILTLALGIGAVTTIFSVADAVLLRPLPYPHQDRLVMVWDELKNLGVDRLGLYGQIFHEYTAQTQIFDATAAFEPRDRNLVGERDSERVRTIAATSESAPHAGNVPAHRPRFAKDEHGDVALLSRFFSCGVMAATRASSATRFDWMAALTRSSASCRVISISARARSTSISGHPLSSTTLRVWAHCTCWHGSDPASPGSRAIRNGCRSQASRPDLRPHYGPNGENPGFRVKLIPLRDEILGDFRTAALVLMLAVAAVLMIVCANIANLLLARAVARQKEIAVRRALGASEGRLLRQWMTESAVLAAFGGTLGALAAVWGVRLLIALSPAALPGAANLKVDARALYSQ